MGRHRCRLRGGLRSRAAPRPGPRWGVAEVKAAAQVVQGFPTPRPTQPNTGGPQEGWKKHGIESGVACEERLAAARRGRAEIHLL